ncbi:unnamed protein product [Discosporangium mesarthrocarpum]
MELVSGSPGALLGYEAAVCGGIPIIHNMQHSYVGDEVTSVMGIMNGTTNFMLTKMELEGAGYAGVLKEAQDLGYAEADPTADVEGHDVRAKIALLAKLTFGQHVPLEGIPCTGISKLTGTDFTCAKMMGCTIKLVGTAAVSGENRSNLAVYVSPVVVPLGGALASARGPGNIVVVTSKNLTKSVYTGPGAGRYPTANSVVNDMVRIAQGLCGRPFPVARELSVAPDFSTRFYVRVTATDGLGILGSFGALAHGQGISIHSVLRADGAGGPGEGEGEGGTREGAVGWVGGATDFVVMTDECKRSQVTALCSELAKQPWARGEPVCMSLL